MNLETLINKNYNELNENDLHVLQYILHNTEACKKMTIVELAEETLTSKSSILRLTKKLGFSGFSEFKYELKNSTEEGFNSDSSFSILQRKDLDYTQKLFSQNHLQPILEKLHTADTIYCYGTGWGQREALSYFVRSLVPLNKFPILLGSLKEWERTAQSAATKHDLVIIVSLTGDISEAEKVMRYLSVKNVPTLSITHLSNNQLASLATFNLYFQTTPVIEQNKDHDLWSLLPMYQVVDLLFRKYVDYRLEIE